MPNVHNMDNLLSRQMNSVSHKQIEKEEKRIQRLYYDDRISAYTRAALHSTIAHRLAYISGPPARNHDHG